MDFTSQRNIDEIRVFFSKGVIKNHTYRLTISVYDEVNGKLLFLRAYDDSYFSQYTHLLYEGKAGFFE